MSAGGYALVFIAIPFGFSALGVWAYRRGQGRALWAAWLAATLLLEPLAYLDWARLPASRTANGTPLAAYVLLAALPTLAAVWAIRWASRREMPAVVQWLAAGTAGWAAVFPALLIGGYVIGRL